MLFSFNCAQHTLKNLYPMRLGLKSAEISMPTSDFRDKTRFIIFKRLDISYVFRNTKSKSQTITWTPS